MIKARLWLNIFVVVTGSWTAVMGTEPPTNPPPTNPPPVEPNDAVATLVLPAGFVAELAAAEPLVVDPVAINWSADGKLWVAEMADYPLGLDGQGQPGGRIRFLEDTNGDGQYDRSTVFLEGVKFPNGVMPWRDGVLVTSAPEIFYAEDTDGDGRADVRRTILEGFFEGNQQLRVNGLRWGLDNWVYCAIGSHHPGYAADTKVRSVVGGTAVELGGRDFRFRPDTGELDPQSGPTQFGRNRDDWGNWFGCMNSYPLWHYVLHDHYLRRNLHVAPPDPRRQLVLPINPKVYPAKAPEKRFHSFEQSGRFTSACGAMLYRDQLLFGDGDTQLGGAQHGFTCEPFHNLVQHHVVYDDGVSFRSSRSDAERETDFFASRDHWCRPVMVQTGPDGALWVVDIYRYMIEHPQFLTPEGRTELEPNYRAGDNRGRLYRVYPASRPPRRWQPLAALSDEQLVAALDSPNGWQRDTVQQLLIWRKAVTTAPRLEQMAFGDENPLARVHALCTLDGLNALRPPVLLAALADEHPGVRRHAVRLAEQLAVTSSEVAAAAEKLCDDPDPKVRLQLACSLGQWSGASNAAALARIATLDTADPFVNAAVLSSVNEANIGGVLLALFAARTTPSASGSAQPAAADLAVQLLGLTAAFDNLRAMADGLQAVAPPAKPLDSAWAFRAVGELLDAAGRSGAGVEAWEMANEPLRREVATRLQTILDEAAAVAAREEADDGLRSAAVTLLARRPSRLESDLEQLASLLVPRTPLNVQLAAVRQMGTVSKEAVAGRLLAGWRGHEPVVRAEVLNVLLSRRPWLTALLDALDRADVAVGDLDAATRQRMTVFKDPQLQQRIAELLDRGTSPERSLVLKQQQGVLKLTGDVARGTELFQKKCSVCHKMSNGQGHEVGPNLASLTDKRPETLLASMLDPSAAVEPKFLSYVVQTVDGRTHTGMLGTETGGSITLVAQEDKRQVLLRSQIEAVQSSGKSLMPDGLEKELSQQDLADVIAYVRAAFSG